MNIETRAKAGITLRGRRTTGHLVVALVAGVALLAFWGLAVCTAPAPAAPLPIASLSSPTHPDEAVWYPDSDPSFAWSAIGAAGYSYLLDQTADSAPAASAMVPALRFSAATLRAGSVPWSVGSGDVTGDGKADLVVADYGAATVSVLAGDGAGGFAAPVAYGTGADPHGVAVADLNGDGVDDVVVTNWGDATISVLLARGDGTLRPAVTYDVSGQPSQIAVGDFNGDGTPDLAVADYASSVVSVLLGRGGGAFAAATSYATAANAEDIVAADFNGDGKLDLAVADWSADVVSVLLGKGDGAFAAKVDYPVGANPHSIVAADFNGDGKLDLAVADWSDDTISVLGGVGDGSFAPATTVDVGLVPADLAVADFNGDGLADLAVADWAATDDTVGVLLVKGDGAFAAPQTFAVPTNPHGLAVGDFNGDGAPDLAVACNAPDGTSVAVLRDLTLTPLSVAYSGKADGVWYFHVLAFDAAGDAGATATRAVRIDTTPPATTVSGADRRWHRKPVTLRFTAVDPAAAGGQGSGVRSTQYSLDGGKTWARKELATVSATVSASGNHSDDGVHTVLFRARDRAGNVEAALSCRVKIDTRGPVTAARPASGRAWRSLSLRYRLSDALSPQLTGVTVVIKNAAGLVVSRVSRGVQSTGVWQRLTWTPRARGVYHFAVYGKDLAGNPQSRAGEAAITIR